MLSLRIVFPKVVGLLLILGATLPGLSQMTLQERRETADKLFELREYSQALPHYETILQNRYSVEIKDKTAICYALIGDNFKAAELHRQLAADMPDSVSYQMLYAESLMKTGQYVKAKAVFIITVTHFDARWFAVRYHENLLVGVFSSSKEVHCQFQAGNGVRVIRSNL